MTASEKLKALGPGWPDPDFSQSEGERTWAQIVAVVEAAEQYLDTGRGDLDGVLAALEEALS